MSYPWTRSEFPEAAKSVDIFSRHVGTLLDAARLERCHFPLCTPPDTVEKWTYGDLTVEAMANCIKSLAASAYLDLGEGRMDAAQSKAIALIRMSRHLYRRYRLEDSMFSESRGLRIINTLLLTADSDLLDLNTLQASVGPLDNQLMTFECEEKKFQELAWRNYLDHAIEMPVISDPWAHMWYCVRKGRWSQMFRFRHYDGLSPEWYKKDRHLRYSHLLTERGHHRMIIEFRQFKNETSQWPNRLDQVSPRLPSEVLATVKESQPLTLSLADHCFVLYLPKPDGLNVQERNLLIQDGRTLTPEERQFLDAHLEGCFRTLITTYRRESGPGWKEDIEDWFLDMARYSVPILLTHLRQGDDDMKIAALNLLGKMADEEYRRVSRHVFFMQDLLDGYRQETTPQIKEHYLGMLGFFCHVAKEDQAKVVRFLKEVMNHGDTPGLRTAAALAFLRASRLEGLYEILSSGIIEDTQRFGEEGRHDIQQSFCHLVFSNHGYPWRWEYGSSRGGYQFEPDVMGSGPEPNNVDPYSESIHRWWLENRDKLKAVLDNDPNSRQIMKEIFPFES